MKHILVFLLLVLFPKTSFGDDTPEWIWSSAQEPANLDETERRAFFNLQEPLPRDRQGYVAHFSKLFSLDDLRIVETGQLKVTSDFAHAQVKVNGTTVAELEPYDPPLEIEIRKWLQEGDNWLELEALSVAGPSALAAELIISFPKGKAEPMIIRTGKKGWGRAVTTHGKIIPKRWAANRLADVTPFSEYNQWKEALPNSKSDENSKPKEDAKQLPEIVRLTPGFAIERLHRASPEEGSWVSMAFDDRGRMIIAREQRGLLRGKWESGKPLRLRVINDTLEECRGLLWKDGALFANANDSKGFYRLRDTTGDDQFDDVVLLQSTEGSAGHGRNDLASGPKKMVHVIHGDSVKIPKNAVRLTVPEPDKSRELGFWARTRAEGEPWEILARGLRNPYGIDFNENGEAFTYDADNEGDVGLPFYRPTRINHLTPGGNYGWHQQLGNTRSLPVYAPESLPTTFDVGRGSPTAVKFGTRSHFPKKWKNALFALDWAYGRIVAAHLTPRGASYYGSGEVFLEGRPLNVTDLDFSPDGSMLFVTGGRKTQSALYRVRYVGKSEESMPETQQEKRRAEFSARMRKLNRQLWKAEGDLGWQRLDDPDPWIRNTCRVILERRPKETRQEAIHAAGWSALDNLTGLLALARTDPEDCLPAAGVAIRHAGIKGLSRTEKLTILRICELARMWEDPNLDTEGVPTALEKWLPDLSDPVNRELCRVLIPLGSKKAVSFAIDFHASAVDQLEALHYLEALSTAPNDAWPSSELRERFFKKLAWANRFSRGDRFMPAFFKSLKRNAVENVSGETERKRLQALLEAEPGSSSEKDPAPPSVSRQFVKHWTMADFSSLEYSGKPNLKRGREVFTQAQCSRCHVFRDVGRPGGPDLTRAASRFSRRDLLLSILEPSRVVAEAHRLVLIKKKDGAALSGRVVLDDFRKSLLYISTNPLALEELTEIPKSDISSVEPLPVSPMPPSLLDTFSKKEIFDLLFWLEEWDGD